MPTLLLTTIPDSFEIFSDPDGYVITVPVLQDGTIYLTVDIRMDPMPGFERETYEASFGFTIDDFDGGGPTSYTQDRYEVERYFGDCSKEAIMPCVCEAVEKLASEIQPSFIFRVTKGKQLPQKALRKHLLITQHLLDMGYKLVDEGTDQFDRLFWLMGR